MAQIGFDAAMRDCPSRLRPRPIVDAVSASDTASFYASLPSFSGFKGISDPETFLPLPDDWVIGLADIVASTEAIAAGQYKMVNTAGAAVISAVSNALGHLDFPFIFGGDGAGFAVGPADGGRATDALAATVSWVGSELGLTLRGATVSLRDVRAAGQDVRVARFAASPDVTYAMFSGGGLAWAEGRLKAGEISVPPAPPEAQPNLTGLSCRFQDHKARHGMILSVLVRPAVHHEDPAFGALISEILMLADQHPDAAQPKPAFKTFGGIRLRPIRIDGRLQHRKGTWRVWSYLRSAGSLLFVSLVLGLRLDLGTFSARRYLREVVDNSDFRKYDDSLMMTLDCEPAFADALEARLQCAERDGVAHFGLHRQGSATITCLVPSITQSNHVHFIDGASGGYAMAAQAMKSRLASSDGVCNRQGN